MIKLSIIIPCYNAEPYIHELLECLDKQMTDEVEVILIDDGSKTPLKTKEYSWLKAYRQKNKGVSKARNRGIELAKGGLIWFIDADDLISGNALSYITSRYDEEWDYMDLSWKSLEDNKYMFKLNSDKDALSNPSASTRVFRRSFIGDLRFPEKKDAAEDEHFTRHLGLKHAKHVCATDYTYFYRIRVDESGTKRYMNGETKTKRIVYYFRSVTKDMTYLLDEIKREDETNEVFVMTTHNEIPELEYYSQIIHPRQIRAYEARGEQTHLISMVPRVIQTQVAIYISQAHTVSGIVTFMYSFAQRMAQYYDIMIVYDYIPMNQLVRLSKYVKCFKNDLNTPIYCDSLILVRVLDDKPRNINTGQTIRMAHCIKQTPEWKIKNDCDHVINVSQASKDSFGEEAENGIVIHNLTAKEETEKALFFVSALRVGATDKKGCDSRCITFAQKLKALNVPFIWVYFGDKPMMGAPEGMIYGGLSMNIKPFIAKADYLVQLSGCEAFSYSLLEALELKTPVIVTPLEQNKEMKIVDGENAYVFDFDTSKWTDEQLKRIVQIPQFEYKHDNEAIIKQWCKILGNKKPQKNYIPKNEIMVIVQRPYFDIQLQKPMATNDTLLMPTARANELQEKGFVRIL